MEKLFSLQVFVSAVVAVIVALMLYAYFNKPAKAETTIETPAAGQGS